MSPTPRERIHASIAAAAEAEAAKRGTRPGNPKTAADQPATDTVSLVEALYATVDQLTTQLDELKSALDTQAQEASTR